MDVLLDFDRIDRCRGGYVAIGNFDGVHGGHQRMLGELVRQADGADVPAVAMTFDPHPITLLAPDRVPPSLSTLQRKVELIDRCGVDVLVAYPTDQSLLNLSPTEFFEQIILDKLDALGLVEGPNFCFGKERAGNVDRLRQLCDHYGRSLTIVEPVMTVDGDVVSSSAIRQAIGKGRIAEAVDMLGHPYQLTGSVDHGAGRGTGIGFPTANLGGITTLLPPDGVYAGTSIVDGHRYAAAVHIGPNPTFDEAARKVEVHLVDFSGDLYGPPLSVDLIDRVRDTMRFDDVTSLQKQLRRDIDSVRSRCGLQDA